MNFFQSNMSAIKQKNEDLYLELTKRQPKQNFVVVETKNNASTLKIHILENGIDKEFYLHSRYNPQTEGEKFAQENMVNQKRTNFLFGFGMGYHVITISKLLAPENELIIMDTNVDIFLEALKHHDFSELFQKANVELCISENLRFICEKVSSLLNANQDLNIITHVPSINAISNDLEDFKMLLMEFNLRKSISSSYGALLEKNFLANLKLIKQNVGLFFGKFENLPIIIVCAGPSLDKNKSLLKGLAGKAVIICVGHALKALLKIDIRPDFIISIDPHEIVYKQIEGLESLDIPFILMANAAALNAVKYQGPKLMACQNVGYLRPGEEKYQVETGGSVSTTALDIAIRMGGDPIIYLGQDLAFSQNKHHCEDSFHSSTDVNHLKNMRTVKGINGEVLPTTLGMLSFKRWIENRIVKEKETTFINASEGGVFLEGFKHLPFIEVIDKYLTKEYNIEKVIRDTILP